MFRKAWLTLLILCGLVAVAACQPQPGSPTPQSKPASILCEQNGGTIELTQDAAGGSVGMCHFPDGSVCEEWAYFRGECGAGTPASGGSAAPETTEPVPAGPDDLASDGWKVYRDTELGYSFHYPADASIGIADDNLGSVTITGPQVAGDSWPMIFVSHPAGREEYRPPDGVSLETWLADHNLLPPEPQHPPAEVRQPDTQIAGLLTIHTRFERSPQSFAYDKFYFAQPQQLYTIVIVHTGDKEDWDLYTHFLENFQFDR